MIEDFMTTEEAAKYLKRGTSLICKLCADGKLAGAKRMGKRMWIIPAQSVHEYVPGPQGFAAVKARKQAEEAKLKDIINSAIEQYRKGAE